MERWREREREREREKERWRDSELWGGVGKEGSKTGSLQWTVTGRCDRELNQSAGMIDRINTESLHKSEVSTCSLSGYMIHRPQYNHWDHPIDVFSNTIAVWPSSPHKKDEDEKPDDAPEDVHIDLYSPGSNSISTTAAAIKEHAINKLRMSCTWALSHTGHTMSL